MPMNSAVAHLEGEEDLTQRAHARSLARGAGREDVDLSRSLAAPARSMRQDGEGSASTEGISINFPDTDEEAPMGTEPSALDASARRVQRAAEQSQRSRQNRLADRIDPPRVETSFRAAGSLPPSRDEARDEARDDVLDAVVDWTSPPQLDTAKAFALMRMPLCKPPSDDDSALVPFDVDARAELDERGYPTGRDLDGGEPTLYPLCRTGQEDFGLIGGAGVRIYFFLVRGLAMLFLVMAVVSLPTILANGTGDMYDKPESDRFSSFIAKTTLGNVYASALDVDDGREGKLWVASVTDTLLSLLLVAMAVLTSRKVRELTRKTDESMVSMADYTVLVTPRAWRWTLYRRLADGKHLVEADVKAEMEKVLPGAQVAACVSAWDEEEAIKIWRRKLELLRALEVELATAASADKLDVSLSKTEEKRHGDGKDAYQLELRSKQIKARMELQKGLNKVLMDLDAVNAQEHALFVGPNCQKSHAVAAFVTMESEPDRTRALELGEITVGGQRCTITEAPEPETVIWEHLQYSAKSRRNRKWTMNSFTCGFLAIGFACIIGANVLKEGVKYVDLCAEVAGPTALNTTTALCADLVDTTVAAETAAQSWYREAYRARREATSMGFPRIADGCSCENHEGIPCCPMASDGGFCNGPNPSVMRWNDAQAQGCHRVDVHEVLSEGGDVDAICYACLCTLEALEPEKSALGDAYCQQFEDDKSRASLWGTIAVVIVTIINQLLKQGSILLAPLEKPHQLGTLHATTTVKVFMCQLFNTAILVLILRSNYGVVRAVPGEHYDQVNAKWYGNIGAPLVTTMIIQFMTPPGIKAVLYVVNLCIVSLQQGKQKTQNALNELLVAGEWNIAAAYGEVLLGAFVPLMYGSGIPLLYWVAAAGFQLRYWVDKWAVLRMFQKPPLYGPNLFDFLDELLGIAVIAHIALGCYFLGVAGGAVPTDYMQFRPFRPHVAPMFVVFCIATTLIVGKPLVDWLLGRGPRDSDDDAQDEQVPPFSEALNSGKIANEDDDYDMDELERLNCIVGAMSEKVQEAYQKKQPPFNSTEMADRIYHALQSHSGEDTLQLAGADGRRGVVERELAPSAAKSHIADTAVTQHDGGRDYLHRSVRHRP